MDISLSELGLSDSAFDIDITFWDDIAMPKDTAKKHLSLLFIIFPPFLLLSMYTINVHYIENIYKLYNKWIKICRINL